jgi:protocatechuate 3,4-dioxygenase beta subunit
MLWDPRGSHNTIVRIFGRKFVPINRHLNRRQVLALSRIVGAALLVGCLPRRTSSASGTAPASSSATPVSSSATATPPACTVRPQQTEGPYFVDERLDRSDIRSNPTDGSIREGVPLQLALRVSQVSATRCTPIAGAIVDIWHCDAQGVYSDVTDRGSSTVGQKFLRGYQTTDATGSVQFLTIYPGWYQGRTVHIHFKICTNSSSGQSYEFTSQLYFDDAVTDRVYAEAPYVNKGERTVRNDRDGIFQQGGDQLLLSLSETNQSETNQSETSQGYAATFEIGLEMA